MAGLFVQLLLFAYMRLRKVLVYYILQMPQHQALMIAYAIGRIGCQVAGDGDWGIYNSAYISDTPGHVVAATPQQFNDKLQQNATYFLNGSVTDPTGANINVTDRHSESLEKIPNKSFKGPSFLPNWMFAYTYPHNVNEDGILLNDCEGKYCRALPQPVFPTPFYETFTCTLLFLFLWLIRRRIKIPGVMFAFISSINGIERFSLKRFVLILLPQFSVFILHGQNDFSCICCYGIIGYFNLPPEALKIR